MSDAQFTLEFAGPHWELISTEFRGYSSGMVYRSVRGKTPGAFHSAGTFQWTNAVKALSALMIRSAINSKNGSVQQFISGGSSSPTLSLDYAISKSPNWLEEMFGVEWSGEITAKRLFRRTNPNMKRPGPVVISLNENILQTRNITIQIGDTPILDIKELHKILLSIEPPKVSNQNQRKVFKQHLPSVPLQRDCNHNKFS